MLRRAAQIYGQRSPEILEARLDYAGMLMLAGDFRTALDTFEQLVTDLTARYGPDHEAVRDLEAGEAHGTRPHVARGLEPRQPRYGIAEFGPRAARHALHGSALFRK